MKKYFKLNRNKVVVYLLVSIIYALIVAATGFVFQALAEAAMGADIQRFLFVAVLALGFLLVDSYFDFVPRFFRSQLVNSLLHAIRTDLVTHYLTIDLHSVMKENSSERANRLTNELHVVENDYLKPLLQLWISLFVFVFSLAGAFYLQGLMTLIMLLLCFIPFLAPLINQKILSSKKQEALNQKKIYLTKFEDFSKNLPVVRLTNISAIFSSILTRQSEATSRQTIDFEKRQAAIYAVSYGLSNIVYSGTWIVGGIFVFNDLLTIPGLIAMTTLMSTVAGPIQTLSELYTTVISSKKVVQHFFDSLEKNTADDHHPTVFLGETIHSLRLEDISFQIDQQQLFDHLSATFHSNKRYAIIGESGTGKSTLLQLILGIQTPNNGKIRVQETDLKSLEKQSYYDRIAYVPQKTAIFEGTIAQNISFFQEIDETSALAAIDQAGLRPWLNRQPEGLSTRLSSKNPLSGGEERRLDIARAIYRGADLIIFDEPTSGLDQKNEDIVAKVLQSLGQKIVLVVTHSTNPLFLQSFDQIFELKQGILQKIEG